jgi:hypothetical protein
MRRFPRTPNTSTARTRGRGRRHGRECARRERSWRVRPARDAAARMAQAPRWLTRVAPNHGSRRNRDPWRCRCRGWCPRRGRGRGRRDRCAGDGDRSRHGRPLRRFGLFRVAAHRRRGRAFWCLLLGGRIPVGAHGALGVTRFPLVVVARVLFVMITGVVWVTPPGGGHRSGLRGGHWAAVRGPAGRGPFWLLVRRREAHRSRLGHATAFGSAVRLRMRRGDCFGRSARLRCARFGRARLWSACLIRHGRPRQWSYVVWSGRRKWGERQGWRTANKDDAHR